MLSLKAKIRDLKENLEQIRKEGWIPSVFYGAGKESTPITVLKSEFEKIWGKAGESSLVKISLPAQADIPREEVDVLIHEVQMDPVRDEPIHIDFLAIDVKKKIKVDVPLEFTGVSEAVRSGFGILVKVLHETEIEALPTDLPHKLVVDISQLATLNSQIFVSDIKLPNGVTMITKGTEIVASITEQKEEKEETPLVDLSAIEVEKKGKKEEEGAIPTETTEIPEKK